MSNKQANEPGFGTKYTTKGMCEECGVEREQQRLTLDFRQRQLVQALTPLTERVIAFIHYNTDESCEVKWMCNN